MGPQKSGKEVLADNALKVEGRAHFMQPGVCFLRSFSDNIGAVRAVALL